MRSHNRSAGKAAAASPWSLFARRQTFAALVAGFACEIALTPTSAQASDMPAVSSPRVRSSDLTSDWRGFHLGVHVGQDWGSSSATEPKLRETGNRVFGGPVGGIQAGYTVDAPSGLVVGAELDVTFPNYVHGNSVAAIRGTSRSSIVEQMDYLGTFRGRVGFAAGTWLPYVTGGLAFAGGRVTETSVVDEEDKRLNFRLGWSVGVGVERAFAPHWSARVEYLYADLGSVDARMPSGTAYRSTVDFSSLRVGLNRRIDWSDGGQIPENPSSSRIAGSDRWEIHGQTTYLPQGYGSFRAPYSGTNSLTPAPQMKATWSNSLFLNARLWDGGEIYFNPELLQGFGLDDTVGVAGFPNGEAQKSNFPYPHYNTSRIFLRQTWGFGGEQEDLPSAPGQLSGKVDISRLTVQAGKFAVIDIFDGNAYAKDTRKDFMNWSMWAPGAFDYSADKVGLTYGATVDLNQESWAVRAGYFLIGDQSNSNNFDTRIFRRGTYALEVEKRFELFARPGKVRAIAWLNSANSGSYRETLEAPALDLDISLTRKGRTKYGYVVSLEQALTDDVGMFGRWSWNDGRTEIMAFTDIDASLSMGTSIKGTRWGRPDDVIGIGGVVNALSTDHREYVAAGGLGVLIGDGRLNYRKERIFESYYAYALSRQVTLTVDYQFIVNPAYNADRGPVSVFSGRLHAEF